jgi:hypothetical protein
LQHARNNGLVYKTLIVYYLINTQSEVGIDRLADKGCLAAPVKALEEFDFSKAPQAGLRKSTGWPRAAI